MVRMVCYWGGFYSVPFIFVGSLFFPLAHTDECFLLTKSLFYPKCATVLYFCKTSGKLVCIGSYCGVLSLLQMQVWDIETSLVCAMVKTYAKLDSAAI